ncbi:MAG: methionine synthase [Bdellovibrionales bacterium RIFOXYA1_FULL_36_14]|nr:MAG: methionine synthase [Bdellovibrionales bacterium RIFOXYA1_FULL_36_14]
MKKRLRNPLLVQELEKRILVLDGATGTALQCKNLTAKDFGGEKYEGCNEHLVLTRPDAVTDVHRQYLDAGADIIETNSFGGAPFVLAEYDLQEKYYEINFQAATIARKIADEYTKKNSSKPRFVAGSMGPTTKSLSLTGGITFDELAKNYYLQAKALYEGGVDYFLLETCNDTRNIKAGLIGIGKLLEESEVVIPIAVSATIEAMGSMLAGQTIESLISSLEHIDLLYLGLNCATGPSFMTDFIRSMSTLAQTRIACVPNAGLPDENGNYLETPEMVSKVLEKFVDQGWINLLGGCCGTTPKHIEAISKMAATKEPRQTKGIKLSTLSEIDYLEITDEKRPILVGERTNSIGSKKFRTLIAEQKFDEAAEIAKNQVKKGAHIIDVCLANPDRDELSDMTKFLDVLIKKIKSPIMIDTTDNKVVYESLKKLQGKAIINSVNLENGEDRFKSISKLAKQFGAALVVGTIDDNPIQGMGITKERKLEIATKSFDLLTNEYGMSETDLYFDPLVFPCGTGNADYLGSAKETIEGVRLIKEKYPRSKTILGISNVSFGLPPAGREVLNTVFLYHCVKAGLDLAIVNAQSIKRYSSLSKEEIILSDNLLFNLGCDPIGEFAAFFRDKKVDTDKNTSDLPLDKRLAQCILDGTKTGLTNDLTELLKTQSPLNIINGPLMTGMKEVGVLFNENKLIVAEVLQSAEVMKAAVDFLRPYMPKNEQKQKGKVLLATVKGDVHDIGKNLVDIILSNNGYEVINMGIKITSEQLISAAKEHRPDIIGLSGLLVKSAQQMEISAGDLRDAGIDIPILVGGAALSKNFVLNKIDLAYGNGRAIYAKDAMQGLALADQIINPEEFKNLIEIIDDEKKDLDHTSTNKPKSVTHSTTRSTEVEILTSAPSAPDFEKHILKNTPIDQVFNFINPIMLYKRHLGVHKEEVDLLANNNFDELKKSPQGFKALEIYEEVLKVKDQYKATHFIPRAVYQFFKCYSEGNTIHILNNNEKIVESIILPRQPKENGLCLSDYVLPKEKGIDNVAMFVTSVGFKIKELAKQLKDQGNYLHSHIVAALAIELAEGYAELLHSNIRNAWGNPDPVDMKMKDRLQARYVGKRYSFGYPACPNLDDQKILFRLLDPLSAIDVNLTESLMMEPEASVSAIVFHHKDASYFNIPITHR